MWLHVLWEAVLSFRKDKEPQALSQMAMAPFTQLQDSPQAQAAAAKEEVSEEEYFKDVNNVYSLLTLEPVETSLVIV